MDLVGGRICPALVFCSPNQGMLKPKINPIDHFIGKDLEKHGHGFAEDADRATLARRASLILNGLPPEPKEVEAFSRR